MRTAPALSGREIPTQGLPPGPQAGGMEPGLGTEQGLGTQRWGSPCSFGDGGTGSCCASGGPCQGPSVLGTALPCGSTGGIPQSGSTARGHPTAPEPHPGGVPKSGRGESGNLSTHEGAPKALRTAGGTQNCPGGNPQSKGDPKATLEEPAKQGSSKAILEEPPEQGGFQSHPMGNYRSGCTAGGVPQIYPEGNPQSKHTAGWGS